MSDMYTNGGVPVLLARKHLDSNNSPPRKFLAEYDFESIAEDRLIVITESPLILGGESPLILGKSHKWFSCGVASMKTPLLSRLIIANQS